MEAPDHRNAGDLRLFDDRALVLHRAQQSEGPSPRAIQEAMRRRTSQQSHQPGSSLPGEPGKEAPFVELLPASSDLDSAHDGACVGASSGIFNSPALASINMYFAERRCRCEDQEVGRFGGPPKKNADRRIYYNPVAKSPRASRQDCRSSVQILTGRAERKGLCSFSSSRLSVNWRLTIRVLLWHWHFAVHYRTVGSIIQAIWRGRTLRANTTQVAKRSPGRGT